MMTKYFKAGSPVYYRGYKNGQEAGIVWTSNTDIDVGNISSIDENKRTIDCYPILVKFGLILGGGFYMRFTEDGKKNFDDDAPVELSQSPIPPIVNKPILDFKLGDFGYFWDNKSEVRWVRYGQLTGISDTSKYLISLHPFAFDNFSKCPPNMPDLIDN